MSKGPLRFLDATVVMYALGGPHPLKYPCQKFLIDTKAGKWLLATDTEVLQEILYRYFSIHRADLAEAAYNAIVEICLEIFPVTLADLDRTLGLLKRHSAITSRDAVHAAVMLNNRLREIISADRHFDQIPGIRRVDPVGV